MKSGSIWIAVAALWLSACDTQRVFEQNHDFEGRVWAVNDTPVFEFEILDPEKKYDVYYNIRNSLAYPYRNLYITYYLQDSARNELKSELNDILLFDKKTGKPKGSGLGDIYDHQVMLLEGHQFQYKGKHYLKLEQFMRMDSLTELLSVGIRVASTTEN